MLKNRSLLAALIVLLVPALASAGNSVFLQGDFGQVGLYKAAGDYSAAIGRVMGENLKAAGGEYVPYRVVTDSRGSHVRFQQHLNGLRVYGAEGVMHVDLEGNIVGVNGEFAATKAAAAAPAIDSSSAMALALGKAGIPNKAITGTGLAYVLDGKGNAVLAWHATVDYRGAAGPQRDMVFASAADGSLVARHPQYHYARALETRDCHNATNQCTADIVSNSPNPISTGDNAIDSAHNFAIATYDYYAATQGRDGINDAGMEMISRVHYDTNYNNAFWDGSKMTYGDGDGTTFIPLSQDADVVAHELTHGVTSNESNLIYSYESGALNESLSDVFGSEVDRQEGATGADIWLIGEDIYTPGTPGDALRDMADPASQGDYDYYPTRYTGSQDNGGVHWNSGISNLAFQLLSDGGTHPRGATSNTVPAIGHSTAADIFYCANVSCLTASSNFEAMRNCTAGCTSGATADAVHEAWDAVGVPGGGGGPPPGGQCSDNNIWTGTIGSGSLVTPNCSASGTFNGVLQCENGGVADLDLYLQKRVCGWGCSWSNVASSTSAACEESVQGYNGSSGTYRWNIDHYSGGTEQIRLFTHKGWTSIASGFNPWRPSSHGLKSEAIRVRPYGTKRSTPSKGTTMIPLPRTSKLSRQSLLAWLLGLAAVAAPLLADDPPPVENEMQAPTAEEAPAAEPAAPSLSDAELEAAHDALRAASDAFHQTLVARDRDAVERHLAGDVIFLDDEDARHGKLDFLRLMEPVFEAKHGFTFAGETVSAHVARSGELGYTIAKSTITYQQPWEDEPTSTVNHTLTVWSRGADQPWKIRVYSTLIVHPELGHATEPRTALMIAWPELADRIGAHVRLDWSPEKTIRAASGEMAYTFGTYTVRFIQDGNRETGAGSFASVWQKDEAGRWQLAAEAYTPPLIED